jgi:TatD DNase family protein
MKYINIHTHTLKEPDTCEVENVFAQDYQRYKPCSAFSVGLHPWHIEKTEWETCFDNIAEAAKNDKMLLVGECGLDRSVDIDFALQEQSFKQQVLIANELGKPLIIHCVRAYNDLIRIKKNRNSDVPWIIHGYMGNRETTLNLIRHGFYFSLGERFLFNERKNEQILIIPENRLFFETDESSLLIEHIYSKAAALLQKNVDELKSVVWSNFEGIF